MEQVRFLNSFNVLHKHVAKRHEASRAYTAQNISNILAAVALHLSTGFHTHGCCLASTTDHLQVSPESTVCEQERSAPANSNCAGMKRARKRPATHMLHIPLGGR